MAKTNQDTSRCEVCGALLIGHETVVYGNEKKRQYLCLRCYNKIVSDSFGIDFWDADFQPITLKDLDGLHHEFKFAVRLHGPIVVLDAYETKKGKPEGYTFSVIGDPEGDILELYMKLYARISQAMSTKHIEASDFGLRITDANMVRAHIDWDEEEEGVPSLIIDGKRISWNEFGRMLTTYEGFHFRLEIFDKSEDC